jgi:hypothetical protein
MIKHPKGHAVFTPSISQMYVLAHAKAWPRQPIPFEPLNFVDPKNANHFHYPFALYSAGHAYLDPALSDEREPMVQKRDRTKTVMIGDSGGFQAATGVLGFDWDDTLGQKAIDQRIELMKWLEHTADYSMVLDWPAWAIDTGRLPIQLMKNDPTQVNPNFNPNLPVDALNNPRCLHTEDPFHNCLNGTVWNNNFFMKHRTPGKTKFLNVLQGRSIEEAYEWYDAVTPFSDTKKWGDRAFEGWALGGSTGGDPAVTMRLLVKLRDDGLLDGDDRWIHVLGRSRLTTAAYLTSLNRALTEHVNPNVQISYDAASAFLYAVNGNYVVDWQVNKKNLSLLSNEFPMHKKYVGSDEPFIYNMTDPKRDHSSSKDQYIACDDGLFQNLMDQGTLARSSHYQSPVSQLLKMGDFILQAPPENEKGYCMDTASYFYIMAHNVQMQAKAVEDVSDKMLSTNAKDHLPNIFIEFDEFVQELFVTETPFDLIAKQGNRFSDLISGERPGVSSLENRTLFPVAKPTLSTGDEAVVRVKARQTKAEKKALKEAKALHANPPVVNTGLFKF